MVKDFLQLRSKRFLNLCKTRKKSPCQWGSFNLSYKVTDIITDTQVVSDMGIWRMHASINNWVNVSMVPVHWRLILCIMHPSLNCSSKSFSVQNCEMRQTRVVHTDRKLFSSQHSFKARSVDLNGSWIPTNAVPLSLPRHTTFEMQGKKTILLKRRVPVDIP